MAEPTLLPTWYLLFDGASADGRGSPDFVGRTQEVDIAKKHYKKCRDNPYSTGKVVIVTDAKHEQAGFNTDW